MTDETPSYPEDARRARSGVLVAISALIALIAVAALLVILSARVDFSFGATDGTGAARGSIPLLFFGAIEGSCLYALLAAIAVESADVRLRLSRLFWPMFAVKVTLSLTVLLSAAQGFDLLARDSRPAWHVLSSPSLGIVQDALLLSTFLALTWLHVTLLTGRGWGRGRVALLIAAMGMVTLMITLLALEIAQRAT